MGRVAIANARDECMAHAQVLLSQQQPSPPALTHHHHLAVAALTSRRGER